MVQTGVNKKLFVNEILPGQEFKISILGGNIHLKIAFGQELTKNLLTYFVTWLLTHKHQHMSAVLSWVREAFKYQIKYRVFYFTGPTPKSVSR